MTCKSKEACKINDGQPYEGLAAWSLLVDLLLKTFRTSFCSKCQKCIKNQTGNLNRLTLAYKYSQMPIHQTAIYRSHIHSTNTSNKFCFVRTLPQMPIFIGQKHIDICIPCIVCSQTTNSALKMRDIKINVDNSFYRVHSLFMLIFMILTINLADFGQILLSWEVTMNTVFSHAHNNWLRLAI